jgi:hypothetical protein
LYRRSGLRFLNRLRNGIEREDGACGGGKAPRHAPVTTADFYDILPREVDELVEETIFTNMLARGRGFERMAPDERRANAHATWLYGAWLREETLFERALAALEP